MALGLLSILQRLSSVIYCGGVYGCHRHCWLVACMTGIACLAIPARPLAWLLLPTLRAIMTATGMADCIGEQQPAASTVCDDCLGRDMRKRRKGTRHHLDCQTAAKCKKLRGQRQKTKETKRQRTRGVRDMELGTQAVQAQPRQGTVRWWISASDGPSAGH